MWAKRLTFAAAVVAQLLLAPASAATIPGMAAGTTGGGSVTPVYPKTNAELKAYLEDAKPRVIVLNKTFDFRNTEGKKTEQGCQPKSYLECAAKNNGYKGQLQIVGPGTGGCDGNMATVTYDIAAKTPLYIKSDKTLRGEGMKGVIMGKGLRFDGNNIIVQNIHVTDLNPHIIWGGDALFFPGLSSDKPSEKIWVDHVKVSLVGRQMVVIAYGGVKSLTISNTQFDGRTPYSSSCDGRHYWGFITDGKETKLTMVNNYIHRHSGRGPKIGGGPATDNVQVHAVNNFFADNSGHSFDVGATGHVLIEGNYFEDTKLPITTTTKGAVFVPTSANANSCQSVIGRKCVANTLVRSGALTSFKESTVLASVKSVASLYKAQAPLREAIVLTNFGVGKLAAEARSLDDEDDYVPMNVTASTLGERLRRD